MAYSPPSSAQIVSVSRHGEHGFSKQVCQQITLVAGLGVEGDAHQGAKVQHLSRVRADPEQPNLRQVHLIHAELFAQLHGKGFDIGPAELGENITTSGIDLLGLPRGTVLRLGDEAEIEVTGLRNPCAQIEAYQPGLLKAVLDTAPDGSLVRKAGIMAIVRHSGTVAAGDPVSVVLPPEPHQPLERV
ncbi:MOSC domain-containing protein [Parerythrobacter jejuensis]|uniref:MOSC domain-containing protein n=1 Tax=Parerythrobacter jejuensis TaxID=795812 RepID=A0A845B1Q6_9SPHN|nr:MOSC domain-containing protein [Parerythrobacter jejuensis]MXP32918.1 MOSC domain-containing protein [Parerythrobacter jejuensis]